MIITQISREKTELRKGCDVGLFMMILLKWSIIESQVFPGQDNNSEPNNQHLITMQHAPCAQNNLRKHYNSTVPAVIKYSDWDLILTPHWFPTAVLMSSMKMTRMPRRPRRMKRAMFSRSGVNYSWLTCNCVTVWCLMTLVPVSQSPSLPIYLWPAHWYLDWTPAQSESDTLGPSSPAGPRASRGQQADTSPDLSQAPGSDSSSSGPQSVSQWSAMTMSSVSHITSPTLG